MGKYLTYRQRIEIETLYKKHTPVKLIAEYVGVCFSTVYKEIKKGRVQLVDTDLRPYVSYSADIAQQKHEYAQTSKGRPVKIGGDHCYAAFLEHKIKIEHRSPAAALADARRAGFSLTLCPSTLYSYIDKGYIGVTYSQLPYGRRKRKRYTQPRPHLVPEAPGIDKRPDYINDRSELGHWEMDCVCGKQGTKEALLCFTERASRFEVIRKLPNKEMKTVVAALSDICRRYDMKTLTVDNGPEFRDYFGMKEHVQEIYYCHPYCSRERGSNENANRIIRRFVPKGSRIADFSDEYIQRVQDWMNHYPRRILGYKRPADFWQ